MAKLMRGGEADMVFTDPPYGMSFGTPYEGGNRGTGGKAARVKAWGKLQNDELKGEEYTEFLVTVITTLKKSAKPKAPIYIWGSWRTLKNYADALCQTNTEISALIVWDKKSIGLGYAHYKPQHEFLFYSANNAPFYGDLTNGDVWATGRGALTKYLHPTMKPVELCARPIGNSSKQGELVLDPFGGSGTTLIACEKLNRKCYMMEIDPCYVSVILARYERFTGKKAEKVP